MRQNSDIILTLNEDMIQILCSNGGFIHWTTSLDTGRKNFQHYACSSGGRFWNERNNRIFNGKATDFIGTCNTITDKLYTWVRAGDKGVKWLETKV